MSCARFLPLIAFVLSLAAHAQPAAQRPPTFRAVIYDDHPRDSRGETVYESQSAASSTTPPGKTLVLGVLLVPRLVHEVTPEVGRAMSKLGTTGSVTLTAVVTAQGDVVDVAVEANTYTGKAAKEAEQNALQAIRHYTFDHATLDGKPIAFQLTFEIFWNTV